MSDRRRGWAAGGALAVLLLTMLSAVGGWAAAPDRGAPDDRVVAVAPERPTSTRAELAPATAATPAAPASEPAVQAPAPAQPPPVPADSGSGRRVVFDQSDQRVWLVDEAEAVARTYLVSGSSYDQLQPGSYAVYSRSQTATSWKSTETMRWMVRFTRGERAAIGFHDIPVATVTGLPVQTEAELGQRLSDGCVRQAPADAEALWAFAPVGTPVVVVA